MFASGEEAKLYDLLTGLGCFLNNDCALQNFTIVGTFCNAYGDAVSCDVAGYVTSLNLSKNKLSGTISDALSTFFEMRYL